MLDVAEIPSDFEVQPIDPDDPTAIDPATCGSCGLTWDDGKSTGCTPVPSGRCPFEYFHKYEEEGGACGICGCDEDHSYNCEEREAE